MGVWVWGLNVVRKRGCKVRVTILSLARCELEEHRDFNFLFSHNRKGGLFLHAS
jgi:hypothetical protein